MSAPYVKRFFKLLSCSALLLCSCATVHPPRVEPLRAGSNADRDRVVLLESQKSPILDIAVAGFLRDSDAEVEVISNVSEADPDLIVDAVKAYHPDVVVTVGTPATVLARDRLQGYPVLFTLVLNQARLKLSEHANMAGIAMEIAPLVEFTQFKMILPQLHRVAAFYTSAQSKALVADAAGQLASMGIELDAIEVPPTGADIAQLYDSKAHPADAVWILNDPIIFKQFPQILARLSRDNVPVITSFSDSFARLGALASLSVDLQAIGSQAAHMTRTLLARRKTLSQLGVQQPNGTRLVVNGDSVKHYGVDISADVMPFISEIVATDSISALQR